MLELKFAGIWKSRKWKWKWKWKWKRKWKQKWRTEMETLAG